MAEVAGVWWAAAWAGVAAGPLCGSEGGLADAGVAALSGSWADAASYDYWASVYESYAG